jgi:maleylpyruvate isomerase
VATINPPFADIDEVERSTQQLLDTVRGIAEDDVSGPSSLPGWTRGHVLAHLARNADSLLNLFTWAKTGVETPQYATSTTRDSEIEAGAARPVQEHIDDLEASAGRLRSAALGLPGPAWATKVRKRGGDEISAAELPWNRLREVQIHHVDLAVGYQPTDWPAEFVDRLWSEVVAGFAGRDEIPPLRLHATDSKSEAEIGSGSETDRVVVSGLASDLVAWLIGRHDGSRLTCDEPLPAPPSWR